NLPDGVTRSNHALFRLDDDGSFSPGSASPGSTFFYGFELTNSGAEPVTVTGFNSNFVFQMHPSRQGDYPDDHCMQFIEEREPNHRTTYPITINPGEALTLFDSRIYHYVYGPVS